MYLVDTHQHLWDLHTFPYAWCAGIPALNRSFLLVDYVAASAGLGIEKSIFVECDVDEPHGLAEAASIAALAEHEPLIRGIVASCRPEHDSFVTQLERLARLERVRGVRRVLHTQPDGVSESPLFRENLRQLPQFKFTFDLCVLARQLPQAIALVDACPDVTFVLDHCGVPDIKGGAFEPWRTNLTELSRRGNVVCKVSGLVAYADPEHWTTDTLRPWFDHVATAFGWDRLLWGGDWPVCTTVATLAQWVSALRELTTAVTPAQQAALFHANAERIYRV